MRAPRSLSLETPKAWPVVEAIRCDAPQQKRTHPFHAGLAVGTPAPTQHPWLCLEAKRPFLWLLWLEGWETLAQDLTWDSVGI